ncbi:MAG: alpha/beta hydrolase [Clostridiales bacterium]|nr:alpha/beta hydrolase [Clostridiales bacterium]
MANEIKRIKTDSCEMEYFSFGTGEKTMVILPGLSVISVMKSAHAIKEAYAPMTDDFTIYVLDRRLDMPEPYTVADMAEDTVSVLRALDLKNICLFGASQGGMIAMTIAVTAPDLVAKLALGSSAARVCGEDFSELSSWVSLAEKKDATALYQAFAQALYPKEMYEAYKDVFTMMSKTVTDEDLSRFVIQAKGTEGFDVLDRLSEITCPVLLLGANDDAVLGVKPSEEIISRLSGREDFEFFMYDGYGHAAFDTAPDYKERLLKFFMKGLCK